MISLVLAPYTQIINFPTRSVAKADTINNGDADGGGNNNDIETEAADYSDPSVQTSVLPPSLQMLSNVQDNYSPTNTNAVVTFNDVFNTTSTNATRIYLSANDRNAVRSLMCLKQILPDFDADPTALYAALPAETQQNIQNAIGAETQSSSSRFKTPEEYLLYMKMGLTSEPVKTQWDNHQSYLDILKQAQANGMSDDRLKALWENEAATIGTSGLSSVTSDTIACVTGLATNDVRGYLQNDTGRTFLHDRIQNVVENRSIDIRVIKSLVYLVTPKDQGGAGHWRIQVRRILQNQEASTESDATIQTTLAANNQTASQTVICDPSLTAAQCGAQLDQAASGTVTDQNGNEYELWLKDVAATQTAEDSIAALRNTSAHFTGQAFDVSQVDDIRCTLVKKVRVGNSSKTKQPIKPIKLAWQTTDGYDQSGGANDFDMMTVLKNAASESMLDLMNSTNGDVSSYQGDLSKASFSDIVGILGQSMLGYVLQSGGTNLKGYDTSSTLKTLGTMYIADYLGLPREIFVNAKIDTIDDVKYLIGRSYVEKKLGLPYGSLDSFNPVASVSQKKIVNDLQGIFLNTGLKKLEHEMSLDSGDLTNGFLSYSDAGRTMPAVNVIGNKVIEDQLNLIKGSWPSTNKKYSEMSGTLSPIIKTLFQTDPGYIDGIMNLPNGSTANFYRNGLGALDYSNLAGTARMNNTSFGLKYFAMNDSAYQLPEGTWQAAMTGDPVAVQSIGIYTIARLLGQDSLDINTLVILDPTQTLSGATLTAENIAYKREDFGAYILRQWLKDSLTRTSADTDTTCDPSKKGLPWSFNADMTGKIVISGAIQQIQDASCILLQRVDATLNYTSSSGNGVKDATSWYLIDSAKATSADLEPGDLYQLLGYSDADGRAVFKRIGDKVLYFGFANKLLGPSDQAKMNLLDTDMTLSISNKDVAFYLTRILQSKTLIAKIQTDWNGLQASLAASQGIVDNVTNANTQISAALSHLNKMSSDTFDAKTMFANLRDVGVEIGVLTKEMSVFQNRFVSTTDATLQLTTAKLNVLITDVNDLSRITSELFAGKVLPSSSKLTIDQINTTSLADKIRGNDSGRSSSNANRGLNQLQLTSAIFGFLSGHMPPLDLFVRLGSASAEANLGLPANSLYYLATNYESIGDFSIDSFYKAIGQARIEEEFMMPANYFQGYTLAQVPPDFTTNFAALQQWASSDIILAQVEGKMSFFAPVTDSLLAQIKTDQPDLFTTLVTAAQTHWKTAYKVTPNASTFTTKTETTLDDVVANINAAKFGDGIRSADNDLLFRMGFSTGRYAGMTAGSVAAWATESGRASAIDQALGLKNGTTKALFTGTMTLNQTDLSTSDKNQLEAGLSLDKTAIEKYVSVLNGQLLPSELQALQSPNSNIDYVQTNPYAAQAAATADSCPVQYSLQDGFFINNSTLLNNSFVYYDQDGRHSFQSQEEAQRYASLHTDRQFTDIFSLLASQLYLKYDAARLATVGLPTLSYDQIKAGMINFASNSKAYSIFATVEGDPAKEKALASGALKAISDASNVPLEVLQKLFTRDQNTAPVAYFKKMVGQNEAQHDITYQIFGALNINISPNMFDAGDFYNILHGDYSSLYRLGTSMIDDSIGVKQGTTMMVYMARDPNTLKCALLDAGGAMLGGLMGLSNVPINLTGGLAGFMGNIGEEKIEETLGLPRGSFRGANIAEVIKNVKPINFILDFKIPIEYVIDQTSLADILGTTQAQGLLNTSDVYKLTKVREFLLSNSAISTTAFNAVTALDNSLTIYLANLIAQLKSTTTDSALVWDPKLVAGILNLPSTNSSTRTFIMRWQSEATAFYQNLNYLDSIFNLTPTTTFLMLTDRVTPADYANKAGNTLVVTVGLTKIAEALGLDPTQSEAATTLATNLQNLFACSGTLTAGVCYDKHGLVDPTYHNWGMLYGNLDQIFGFNLDQKASLPHGTIQKILNTPDNTFPILLGVAATKIDASLSLDSTKLYSLTGLYNSMYADVLTPERSACEAQYFPSAVRDELASKLSGVNHDIATFAQDSPSYVQAVADKATIQQEIASRDQQVSTCQMAARSTTAHGLDALKIPADAQNRVIAWAEQAGAQYLHDQILKISVKNSQGVSEQIGVDVPVGDIVNMFQGDTKEYQVIGLALLANYVYVTDPIRTKNCNPSEYSGGECRTAVPTEMRVNYQDIYMAFYGVPSFNNGINKYQLSAWQDVTGGNSNPVVQSYNLNNNAPLTGGDISPTGILLNVLASPVANSAEGVNNLLYERYGFTQTGYNAEVASLQALTNPTDADKLNLDKLLNPEKYYNPWSPNFVGTTTALANVDRDMRKAAQDYLEYKTMDGMLWKLDDNVFPGFSRALMTGNAELKMAALSLYIKNGLIHGHIFGINFDAVNPVAIAMAANLIQYFTATTDAAKQTILTNFVNGAGFDYLTNFIASNSKDWLGFALEPAMAQGLLAGIFTGQWGLKSISLDGLFANSGAETVKIGTRTLPTLGGAIMSWAVPKLFTWADKALGLKDGQSFQLAYAGYKIYTAAQLVSAAQGVKAAADVAVTTAQNGVTAAQANLELAASSGDATKVTDATGQLQQAQDNLIKAQTTAAQGDTKITDAKANLTAVKEIGLQILIQILLDKLIGKQVSTFEHSLGLVPGSLMPVIATGVYNLVAPLFGLGPQAWTIAIVTFVLLNLFGVYKIEEFCDADGYFPLLETPQPSVNDISGLGEWGGDVTGKNINQVMKNGAISAAQYKASSLIGNMLSIGDNATYNDSANMPTTPIQIMTGRSEDVAFWQNTIDSNMCKRRLGDTSTVIYQDGRAICDGDTRLGVWANPQTIAWTHIGF